VYRIKINQIISISNIVPVSNDKPSAQLTHIHLVFCKKQILLQLSFVLYLVLVVFLFVNFIRVVFVLTNFLFLF